MENNSNIYKDNGRDNGNTSGWLANIIRNPLDGYPATPISRLIARITDMVTVLSIHFALVVTQIFWFMDDLSDRYQYEPWDRAFVASLTYIGLYFIYEVVFHTFNRGQTPGKLLMNIHLVSDSSSGNTPSDTSNTTPGTTPIYAPQKLHQRLFQVMFRAIFPIAPLVFFAPYPIWTALALLFLAMTIPLTSKKKSTYDFLAGTYVIYSEPTDEDREIFKRERQWRKDRTEKYSLGLFRTTPKNPTSPTSQPTENEPPKNYLPEDRSPEKEPTSNAGAEDANGALLEVDAGTTRVSARQKRAGGA